MAFYRFARVADDVADNPELTAAQKIVRLDAMERCLLGGGEPTDLPECVNLRSALRQRELSPRHALDLLEAFRADTSKRRYADWDELMSYCAWSAMPVGRFVLDVHGEPVTTWAASDATCAALQIINHLQDCGADYRNLDRVYLPMDLLAVHKVSADALGARVASPPLRDCIRGLADKVAELLRQGEGLADSITDRRLRMEISVIQALAFRLTRRLSVRDPLSEETHLNRFEALGTACLALLRQGRRGFGASPIPLPLEPSQ